MDLLYKTRCSGAVGKSRLFPFYACYPLSKLELFSNRIELNVLMSKVSLYYAHIDYVNKVRFKGLEFVHSTDKSRYIACWLFTKKKFDTVSNILKAKSIDIASI